MKIISCGCSFMTLDKNAPGTHLSELIAKHFDADLASYAKLGASNFAIRLQIEEAIAQKPDLILIGWTSEDRIDIPLPGKHYAILNGVRNIEYSDEHTYPEFYNEPTSISLPISLLEQRKHLQAPIKSFLMNLHDSQLKTHQDLFMAYGALDRLAKFKIPFVFTEGGLTGPWWDEWQDIKLPEVANPWLYVNSDDSIATGIYHTTYARQQELAEQWIKFIT